MATAKPPTPPKSSAPGKSVPESEKKLGGRDTDKLKTPEFEEKKTEASGASEESRWKKETKEEENGEKDESEKIIEDEEEDEEEEEEENEDEEEETEESLEIAKSIAMGSKLLSPEGVIMLPLAAMIDLSGIILLIFALDDFGVTDIIGMATIGVWVVYKSGFSSPKPDIAKEAAQTIEKAEKLVAKAGKYGRWLRPLVCVLGEIIPYLGAIPFWTYLVWKTLMDS